MSVRARKTDVLLVPVDVDGENLEGFYAELNCRLKQQLEEIHLDCSLLEHASSTHINTLWQARNRCEEAGVAVRLISVGYGLARVLEVLDLCGLFLTERDGVEAAAGAPGPDMDTPPPEELVLDVCPTVEGIRDAMRCLHGYVTGLSLGEIFAFDLETVFYEVTTNIRLHGEIGGGQVIRFTAAPRNGVFRLRFEDPGPHFDPTSREMDFDLRRAAKNRERRGFGLAMIKRLVDRISYERQDEQLNILNLEKSMRRNGGHLQ
jgi:anti-sigma regulatory factor (Ser/Thr protein kinase)/anti-anti-sigma regulatory factor